MTVADADEAPELREPITAVLFRPGGQVHAQPEQPTDLRILSERLAKLEADIERGFNGYNKRIEILEGDSRRHEDRLNQHEGRLILGDEILRDLQRHARRMEGWVRHGKLLLSDDDP